MTYTRHILDIGKKMYLKRSFDWYEPDDYIINPEIEAMEEKKDEIGLWFKDVLKYLYDKNNLDIEMVEHLLEGIADYFGYSIPDHVLPLKHIKE